MAEQTNATVGKLSPEKQQRFWIDEIQRSQRYFDSYWDLCDRLYDRYRDERAYTGSNNRTAEGGRIQLKRFNIFWSNTQTLFPALYTDPPPPVVARRYKDDDPVGRVAVEILERSLQFIEDPAEEQYSFDSAARAAVLDYLLIGRGVTWVRYEKTVEQIETEGVFETLENGTEIEVQEGTTEERTVSESIYHDHIHYRDFVHMVAPTWDHVLKRGWASRTHYLTREEVREQFGAEAAERIQLTANATAATDQRRIGPATEETKDQNPIYAEVREIWNVPDRQVYYISKDSPRPLKVERDPLGLRDFFPCGRPLYGCMTPNSLVPVPDYTQYHDQAENLDRITDKKWKLTTALRVAGIYAGSDAQTLQQIFDGSDRNIMIPVQDWAAVQDKGGVSGLVEWLPLDQIARALVDLQAQEEANKQQIYEITGIADIVRGQSKAQETLGAQRIKGQWASVRISDRQRTVADHCRNILRIDAEIVAEHYDPKTIAEMTNFTNARWSQIEGFEALFAEALELLRGDKSRTFRVDVETRDTVFADQAQERQQNVEMLSAMAQFLASAAEIGAATPEAVPVLGEMANIGIKQFTGSYQRQLEIAVEVMTARLNKRVQQQMENPQPAPEEIEAQQEAQKTQMEAQDKQAGRQLEARGQVLDFRSKLQDQALEKRGQDLDFRAKMVSELGRALSAGSA